MFTFEKSTKEYISQKLILKESNQNQKHQEQNREAENRQIAQ